MTSFKLNKDMAWRFLTFTCISALITMMPDMAHAGTPFTSILCNAYNVMRGGPAKIIATLAVIVLGISAFFGKLQWATAVLIAVGLGLIFGATVIVEKVAGSTGCADAVLEV